MRPKALTAYIITPVIGYISMPYLYSAQFLLPREHSLPGIAAYNGAGKFRHNNLSPLMEVYAKKKKKKKKNTFHENLYSPYFYT